MVGAADELAYAAVLDTQASEKLSSLLGGKFGEFALDLGTDDHSFAAQMLGGVFTHGLHVLGGGGLAIKVREIVLSHVAGKECRFRCE